MHTRALFACFAIAAVLTCGMGQAAGLYKCVDASGSVSYQDTDCGPGTARQPIDRRYANSLGLPVSPADKALVKRFEAQRLHAHRQRLERIGHTLRAWRTKAQECNSLKRRWYRYLDTHQLAHSANPSPKAELLDRMRQACSD